MEEVGHNLLNICKHGHWVFIPGKVHSLSSAVWLSEQNSEQKRLDFEGFFSRWRLVSSLSPQVEEESERGGVKNGRRSFASRT